MLLSFSVAERDPLWRREMRERWRRPITLFFVTLYVAGLCWFAYSLYAALVPTGNVELGTQARGIGHRIFVSLMGLQIGVWIPVAMLLAAPTIAAERERRALTEYLLAGLLPKQIVRAKFASIATFVVVMCAVPLPVLSLCFPLGGVEPLELFAGVLLEIALAVTCAAIGLLISVNSKRVTAAMQVAILLSLVLLFFAALSIPGLLETTFWSWLTLVGLLVFVTGILIVSCEDSLAIVARHLELEELRAPMPLSAFPPPPTPAPIPSTVVPPPAPPVRPVERVQPPQTQRQPQIPLDKKLQAELMEGSSWDAWAEKVASVNAVALREVRVGLRASRIRMALSPDTPTLQLSPWVWVFVGALGAVFLSVTEVIAMWVMALAVTTVLAMIAASSGASAAFTREREQKMLSQLQMCPLSALEIVTGKIGAMLLLITRSWGGVLLALFIAGLARGVGVGAGTAAVVVLSLLFAINIATLLSLLCHHTAIASGGTLGALLVAFVLLPIAPDSLAFFMPSIRGVISSFPLGTMWVEPMRVLIIPGNGFVNPTLSPEQALLRVACSLLVLNLLLILASTGVWSRTSPDDGEAKTRFWERDISRSWR